MRLILVFAVNLNSVCAEGLRGPEQDFLRHLRTVGKTTADQTNFLSCPTYKKAPGSSGQRLASVTARLHTRSTEHTRIQALRPAARHRFATRLL